MPEIRIEATASPRGSAFCPVGVDLDVPVEKLEGLALVDETSGATVPFQAEAVDGACRINWIIDSIAAGQTRAYALTDTVPAAAGAAVDLSEQGGGRIEVKIGGAVFTCFRYGGDTPRPVLYPVIGPFGSGVTRSFPMDTVEGDDTDHVHHRSIWVAWGDVNGSDNWGEVEGSGRVVHRGFEGWGGGQVFGWVAARDDWLDGRGSKLMEDRMACRFYNLSGDARLMDLEVTFHASEGDVRFGDTKEGGICSVRVASSMDGKVGGWMENSFGARGEPEVWGRRASWCDYSGAVGAHTVGIAVFDHPRNVGYPTYWHARDYGLMTANPFGLSHFLNDSSRDGSWVLPAGERATFRYRVFVHVGDAAEGGVRNKYLDWVYPPAASVVR